jgi:hypothetical protein
MDDKVDLKDTPELGKLMQKARASDNVFGGWILRINKCPIERGTDLLEERYTPAREFRGITHAA